MIVQQIKKVFLDTSPLIYLIEQDARYLSRVHMLFERIDAGDIWAVTSPITLAECLVVPYRNGQADLIRDFVDQIVWGNRTTFAVISDEIACRAAELRARYNLLLDDALQLATCLVSGCDAFLTNDRELKRVKEVNVVLVEEIQP